MAKTKQPKYEDPTAQHDRPVTAEFETGEVHEPTTDERGRIRLDRRFTPDEALAQDAAHRERALVERERRFNPAA